MDFEHSPVSGRSLTLWVPELLHPQRMDEAGAEFAQLKLPVLQKLLSKADYCFGKKRDFAAQASYLFHQPTSLPSAALRAAVLLADDFALAPNDFWLSVDPVQMIPDRDTLVLIPPADLALTDAESQQLLDSFNRHFAQDRVRLLYGSADQWFMQITQPIDLQSTALAQVAYQSVNNAYPRGNAANYWRQLINETQMLFHTHPLNEIRREQGLPEINSIWPWGEGSLQNCAIKPRNNAAIFADDPYLQGLARVSQAKVAAQVESFSDWFAQAAPGHNLVYPDKLANAIAQMQQNQWLNALQSFEQQWLEPLEDALQKGEITSLFLDFGANKQFYIHPKHLKRFWRWNKKLRILCD